MREWKYDYLRVVSAFAVILLHIESRFKAEYFTQPSAIILKPFVHAACVFAVPCFLCSPVHLLSGETRNRIGRKVLFPFFCLPDFTQFIMRHIILEMGWQ